MKNKILILAIAVLALPSFVSADNALGENRVFNVESSYDSTKRAELSANLIKISPKLYWYADNVWWGKMTAQEKDDIKNYFNLLTEEFESKIYPTLTAAFGSEWNPGIDKDARITILVHPMKKESGGYTDTSDEYPKAQVPESNEREMIYLNSEHIKDDIMKSFLAHEFVHLITFNQKDNAYDLSDDVWLNEARAEYASTLLGYDANYNGSNLQSRVKDFLSGSFDSLTEWRDSAPDYGVVNLFTQYLVDHYGVKILADSLKIRKTGIDSINSALAQNNFKIDFAQIFTDWTIALFINDCSVGENYCYLNQNLKNFRVTPMINYLPLVGDSTLSVNNTTKDWAGNWHKFLGGKGKLEVEFKSYNHGTKFKVPYIIEDSNGNFTIDNLAFDANMTGKIVLDDFGTKYSSLTIIPVAQNAISGFSGIQPSYNFFWSASAQGKKVEVSPLPINNANAAKEVKIAELKTQIMAIQLKIIELLKQLIQLLLTESALPANM
ncbi:MAG: hypothetical protein HYW69_00940 [Candidatus Nealsonbacteria bacterium]|nr:hypothetical protein [Candidatus Nealsonbacteria bacterium]